MAELGPMRRIVGLLEETGRVVGARLACSHEVKFGKTTSQAVRRHVTRRHCPRCVGEPTLEEEGAGARLRFVATGIGPARVGWGRDELLARGSGGCSRDRSRLASIAEEERRQADEEALEVAAALVRTPERTADFRYAVDRLEAALRRSGRVGVTPPR